MDDELTLLFEAQTAINKRLDKFESRFDAISAATTEMISNFIAEQKSAIESNLKSNTERLEAITGAFCEELDTELAETSMTLTDAYKQLKAMREIIDTAMNDATSDVETLLKSTTEEIEAMKAQITQLSETVEQQLAQIKEDNATIKSVFRSMRELSIAHSDELEGLSNKISTIEKTHTERMNLIEKYVVR
ncbi:hypothetical protein RRL34_004267 [Vibrio parahaemolyticus]|nr:hypothetical protein [Vibrio parahaemolyticus]